MDTATLMLGAGALTVVGQLSRGSLKPTPAVIIGTGIAGAILIAAPPGMGAPFAALIFVTSLLVNGADVAAGVMRALAAAS